jgi:translin family protein
MILVSLWVACYATFGVCDVEGSSQFIIQLFPLPLSDYVLGICDLSGELMRLAISSISKPNGRMRASQISLFVRGCKAGKSKFKCTMAGIPQTPISLDFETLTPYIRDLHKKQEVTVQSLRKVEEGRLVLCSIGLV